MGKSKKDETDKWTVLISERLKVLRKEAGYTSYETFALDHGLDRKQYWRLEAGANITIKTLIKILSIHGKELSTFFKEVEQSTKK
jgi:transcriptional regulator with XRE-family HTH domain